MIDIELILFSIFGFPAIINTLINTNVKFTYYLTLYLIIGIMTTKNKRTNLKKIDFLNLFKKNKLLILSIVILIISRLISVIQFKAPPLHDPVTHAYYAKTISKTGVVNFSYSPLLHSITGFISQVTQIPTPKMILIINSIIMVLTPINTYFLIKKIFGKKYAYPSFIAIAIAPYPNNFFFLAGKNALVLAILISLQFFNYLYDSLKSVNKKQIIKLLFSFILLFFSHYPTFAIVSLISIPYLLINSKKFFKNKETTIVSIISILIIVFITCFWGLYKIDINSLMPKSNSENIIVFSFTEKLNSFNKNIKNNINDISNKLDLGIPCTVIIFFIVFLLTNQTNKQKIIFPLTLGMAIAWITSIILKTFTNLYIVNSTFVLYTIPIIYILMIITITSLISKKKQYKYYITLVFFIFTFKQVEIGTNYRKIEFDLDPISQFDTEAFNFISNNIPNNSLILSANKLRTTQNDRIASPIDSGMWIPIYTNSKIATPFWEFPSDNSFKISQLTKKIIKEKRDDTKYIKELKKYGINYVYLDKGIFGAGLNKNYFNNIKYESIFKNNEVEILKI